MNRTARLLAAVTLASWASLAGAAPSAREIVKEADRRQETAMPTLD